jgi:hypothetical protein
MILKNILCKFLIKKLLWRILLILDRRESGGIEQENMGIMTMVFAPAP